MAIFYVDTSAIVKRYRREKGTEVIDELLEDPPLADRFYISFLKFMQRFSVTRLAEYFDIIRGVIREGQSQGVFRRELNEKLVTKCFFGALDEMATNWVLSQRQYRLVDMAPAVADLFLRGMLNPSREDKGGAGFPACAAGQAGMPAPPRRAVKGLEEAEKN